MQLINEGLDEPDGAQDTDIEDRLRLAERELLESKAKATVKKKIVDNVLWTEPVLKAVHHQRGASPAER